MLPSILRHEGQTKACTSEVLIVNCHFSFLTPQKNIVQYIPGDLFHQPLFELSGAPLQLQRSCVTREIQALYYLR